MSGGSYNYLYSMQDLDDIERKLYDLKAMAARLQGLSETNFPGSDAAAVMTLKLIGSVELWAAHVQATAENLGGVWKAVEWWDSGDYGPRQVKEELDKLLNPKN